MVTTFTELQEKYSISDEDFISVSSEKKRLGYKILQVSWLTSSFITITVIYGVFLWSKM